MLDTRIDHSIPVLMMKRLHIMMLLASVLLPAVTMAGKDFHGKFHYGVEWGVSNTFTSWTHCTFQTVEGYVVENRDIEYSALMNATVLGFVSMDISKWVWLSAYSGYTGLRKGEHVIPLTLRSSFALNRTGTANPGAVFIEGGCGFRKGAKVSAIARVGYTYRVILSSFMALDLTAGTHLTLSHPDVYDKYSERKVPPEALGVSSSLNTGVFLSMALVF